MLFLTCLLPVYAQWATVNGAERELEYFFPGGRRRG